MARKRKNELQESTYLPGCEIREDELRNVIDRLETLMEERKLITQSITEAIKDAESIGFHPKVLREVMRLRSMDANKRLTLDNLLPIYLKAVEEPCGNISIGVLYYQENKPKVVSRDGKVPANS